MKRLAAVGLLCSLASGWGLRWDLHQLREQILRLHVVAASDRAGDQQLKLQVRDAVLEMLDGELSGMEDAGQVFSHVEQLLPRLEQTANRVLEQAGAAHRATVSLDREAFPRRRYEGIALPAGIYHSLRVVIGEGSGHNWWCVVFPSLCGGSSKEELRRQARDQGLSDPLSDTLTGDCEIRFWVLDQLGRLENFLEDARNHRQAVIK